jgi:hypothetical protein
MSAKGDIATAAKAIMLAAVPEAEGRVFRTRILPTNPADWPCVLVVVDNERVATNGGIPGRRAQARSATLTFFGVTAGDRDDLEDRLDLLGDRIEAAIAADHFLTAGGQPKVSDLRLASTVATLRAEGEAALGVLRKDFEVTYHTNEANPGQLLAR